MAKSILSKFIFIRNPSKGYFLLESLVAVSCLLFLSITVSKSLCYISSSFHKISIFNASIDKGQSILESAQAYYELPSDEKLQVIPIDLSRTLYIYTLAKDKNLSYILRHQSDE